MPPKRKNNGGNAMSFFFFPKVVRLLAMGKLNYRGLRRDESADSARWLVTKIFYSRGSKHP